MVEPMVLVPAAVSLSIIAAWTLRDHGQRPMFWMLLSSMATTTTLSPGSRDETLTPRS
jgi:hypothetical protein